LVGNMVGIAIFMGFLDVAIVKITTLIMLISVGYTNYELQH
jgi:hypothetical protein